MDHGHYANQNCYFGSIFWGAQGGEERFILVHPAPVSTQWSLISSYQIQGVVIINLFTLKLLSAVFYTCQGSQNQHNNMELINPTNTNTSLNRISGNKCRWLRSGEQRKLFLSFILFCIKMFTELPWASACLADSQASHLNISTLLRCIMQQNEDF